MDMSSTAQVRVDAPTRRARPSDIAEAQTAASGTRRRVPFTTRRRRVTATDRPESSVGTRHSTRVVRACCVVLAVHIVTDSFVQLRAGTSPGDHLVSGTVPVVVIALAAALFGGLRAGATATIALVLGVAAVIGGAGAPGTAFLHGRIDLSTTTGAVGTIAGIVLVAVGMATLYRSRRKGGTRMRRWSRRTGRGLLGLALALFVSAPIGMGYVVANRSHPAGPDVDLGQAHENITFETEDGLTLAGSYVRSRNGAAVIVFPGRSGRHTSSRARLLQRHGYGVLVFEPRGQGDSDGDPNLLGWSGEEDLRAAIRYLQSRPDVEPDRIGGLGLSVGGELMLQTAAHDPDLRAVVSEGAGTRWAAEDLHTPAPANLIQLPFSTMATLATAVFTDSLPPARIEDLVDDIAPRPILLIWTPNGVGGEWFNPRYFDLAGEPKSIWEIPDSSHTNGLATRPAEYEQRVVEFFDAAL